MDSEALIRHVYSVAEVKDFRGFVELFTEDGTFTDESIGVTYRGQEIARTGESYATAFSDMHRELFNVYLSGDDMVVVQLALQGTHNGPLQLPMGTISATDHLSPRWFNGTHPDRLTGRSRTTQSGRISPPC